LSDYFTVKVVWAVAGVYPVRVAVAEAWYVVLTAFRDILYENVALPCVFVVALVAFGF
jgi:hypothetical protein